LWNTNRRISFCRLIAITRNTNATEEYNGSTWTSVEPVNTARGMGMSVGIQTAALMVAGNLPGATSATEEYDGTTWTSSRIKYGNCR
jgi:hypothetical protein